MPITSSASISSEIRIEPSSATIPVPTLADIMYPNAYGITSRRSHHAENCPAYAGAPTARVAYAPSIPHCNPMMKINDQITIVEEMIKIPAWRNVSPKNRNTRRLIHQPHDPRAKPRDLPKIPQPHPRRRQHTNPTADATAAPRVAGRHQRITVMSGCVASNVCVNT